MRKKPSVNETALMVTTAKAGVFFGYGTPSDKDTITLKRARMCVYWSADMKGVFGLASIGPSKSCNISPSVSEIVLREVVSCVSVSPDAVTKWESAPWA